MVPSEYPSEQFEANTTVQQGMLTDLGAFSTSMKVGRTGASVELSTLQADFARLRGYTSNFGQDVDTFMAELAKASGGTYDPRGTVEANGEGGVFSGNLYDEYGVEMEQLIEKGLFAAMCYHHAAAIMKQGELTGADIDEIVAVFGATPAFRNSSSSGENADRFAAAYASRRDKNDGTGPYTGFRDAAKKARAAIAAGSEYQDELNEALAAMRRHWERSQAGTVVNYLYASIGKWSMTSPADADLGSGTHAFAEAVGFLKGWRGIDASSKIITDAQIDELLTLMRVPTTGAATCQQFWLQPATTLAELQTALNRIQSIYGFTDAEMNDFRQNWVSAQGR